MPRSGTIPLTPYQVMEQAMTIRNHWFEKLIEMVNDELCTHAAILDETGQVDIKPTLADPLDPQGWYYWQELSHDIIEWFEDMEWIVEPGKTRYEFVFRLPGTLINVTNGDEKIGTNQR